MAAKTVSFNLPVPYAEERRSAEEEIARLREALEANYAGTNQSPTVDAGRFRIANINPAAQAIAAAIREKRLESAEKKRADYQGKYQEGLLESLRAYKTKREGGEVELPGPQPEGVEGPLTGRVPGDPRAYRQFQQSPYPEMRALAEAEQAAEAERFKQLADRASFQSLQGADGDPSQLQPKRELTEADGTFFDTTEGRDPGVLPGMQVTQSQLPSGTVVNQFPSGKQSSVDTAPKTSVTVGPENKLLGNLAEQLPKLSEQAASAAQGLRATETALNALATGARTGFGEGWLQNARTLATSITGIKFDASAPTAVIAKALAENTLAANGGSLGAGFSNADRDFMERATGGLMDDPAGLERILTVRAAALSNQFDNAQRQIMEISGNPDFGGAGGTASRVYGREKPRTMLNIQTPEALASFLAGRLNIPYEEALQIANRPENRPQVSDKASGAVRGSMGASGPSGLTPEQRRARIEELRRQLQEGGGQ
jgi:hypothetical protein